MFIWASFAMASFEKLVAHICAC